MVDSFIHDHSGRVHFGTKMAWQVALCCITITTLGHIMRKFYTHRSRINMLRKQGIPMPEGWSWLTGHLLVLQKCVSRLPPDANVNLALAHLAREYSDTEMFLLDSWPIYPPLLIVYDPDTALQISTKYNLPKTDIHERFMEPITGGSSLVSMGGLEWKFWRSLFNPGFSASAITESIPHVIRSGQLFQKKLEESSRKGITLLDNLTTQLTLDVIMKVTLDVDIDNRRSKDALANALNTITRWHSFWDPRVLIHPFRPLIQKYHSFVIDRIIRAELEQRFRELKDERTGMVNTDQHSSGETKSVVSLALKSYISENNKHDMLQKSRLDDHFARYAINQIRLFLFAGNDTTSSTIVYVYHLLSQHQKALQTVREEHDLVFGTEISTVAESLKTKPELLSRCKYTLAVIKETLRLYPPAGTMRSGQPGIVLTDRHGNFYPMDFICTTVNHPAVHQNPRLWLKPNEFIPERFLVAPGHELYPYPPAFRPFEQGPRNCIGQTLVYSEIQVAMILTLRTFDIRPAYDEWDLARAQQASVFQRLKIKVFGEPKRTVQGDRAYQTDKAGTHPSDGYPCHVSMANWKGSRLSRQGESRI